jgi:hypothetical protein
MQGFKRALSRLSAVGHREGPGSPLGAVPLGIRPEDFEASAVARALGQVRLLGPFALWFYRTFSTVGGPRAQRLGITETWSGDPRDDAAHPPPLIALRGKDLVFHPLCSFRHIWDVLVTLLCLYSVFETPFRIAYHYDRTDLSGIQIFNLVVDLLFCLDIALSFNTGFFKLRDHLVVMNRRRIARRYLRTWFLVDLAASLPYGLVFASTSSPLPLNILSLLRILRLGRLLRGLRTYASLYYASLRDWAPTRWIRTQQLRLFFLVFLIVTWWWTWACFHFLASECCSTLKLDCVPSVSLLLRFWASTVRHTVCLVIFVILLSYL